MNISICLLHITLTNDTEANHTTQLVQPATPDLRLWLGAQEADSFHTSPLFNTRIRALGGCSCPRVDGEKRDHLIDTFLTPHKQTSQLIRICVLIFLLCTFIVTMSLLLARVHTSVCPFYGINELPRENILILLPYQSFHLC